MQKQYNTVYPAGASQNSASGTQDVCASQIYATRPAHPSNLAPQIINRIQTILASNPSECIILEGYSQGAAATVNALPRLTGASFDAVKGVFLIGNPTHKAGLTCNVDNRGGTTTRNVNGLSARASAGVPATWVGKTLDVCILVRIDPC